MVFPEFLPMASSSARTFLRSSMLSNVRRGQIKPAGRTRFRGQTEPQGFVADTCGFLDSDMVRSPEKGDWRIYRHYRGLRAAHLKREIKFSATIRQSAISKVANSGSIAAHAASALGVIDAPGKALWSQDGSALTACKSDSSGSIDPESFSHSLAQRSK